MKKQISLALFLIVVSLNAVVHAQEDADIRKELETQYKKLAEAHDRKDLKAILAVRTSDFHTVLPDGRVTDSKLMEEYSKGFLERNQPPFNFRFTIQKLTVSFNKLIAMAEVFQEGSRYQDLAGKRRKVETSVVQREIWAKTSDGWKLKSVDNVRDQKKSVDGKPVDPTKPYHPDDPPYNPDDMRPKKPETAPPAPFLNGMGKQIGTGASVKAKMTVIAPHGHRKMTTELNGAPGFGQTHDVEKQKWLECWFAIVRIESPGFTPSVWRRGCDENSRLKSIPNMEGTANTKFLSTATW